MGGLPKKIYQIRTLSEDKSSARLLVDSGNLLFNRKKIDDGLNQSRLTAKAILEIHLGVGYDAIAVGPYDLAGGLDWILENSGKKSPWVSANIFDDQQQLLFPAFIQKTINGREFTIIGISAEITGIPTKPWHEVLPGLIGQIKDNNRDSFIVVLSNLDDAGNREMAATLPEIQIIIGGDQNKNNIQPVTISNSLYTQTSSQGKYQGLLKIIPGKTSGWGNDLGKELADMQNRQGSVNWQLRRLRKRAADPGQADQYRSSIDRLEKELVELEEKIEKLKSATTLDGGMMEKNRFEYLLTALKKNMPDDEKTTIRLAKLDEEIRILHGKVKQNSRDSVNDNSPQKPLMLVGSQRCISCHESQGNFWLSTNHAQAYVTLKNKGKQMNLNCLPCHLTMETKNGNLQLVSSDRLLSYPEELQGVGCENCHGNGYEHAQNPEHIKPQRKPVEKTCRTCHTDDHDDNFVYDTKIKLIACPVE